jgi:hypothetical protein
MVNYTGRGAGRRWIEKLEDNLSAHDKGWSGLTSRFSQLERFVENYSNEEPNNTEDVCFSLVNAYLAITKLPEQIDKYCKSISFHIGKAVNEGKIEPKSDSVKQGNKIVGDLGRIAKGIEKCFGGGRTYTGLTERVDSLRTNKSSKNLQKQLYSGLRKGKQGIALLQQLNDYLQQLQNYEIEIAHKVLDDKKRVHVRGEIKRKLIVEVPKRVKLR